MLIISGTAATNSGGAWDDDEPGILSRRSRFGVRRGSPDTSPHYSPPPPRSSRRFEHAWNAI